MFMIFSYANGTDSIIYISKYLKGNKNYDENDKTFLGLKPENFINENNIFNYNKDSCIKLVSIPKEIIIFIKNEENEIQLYNDSDICEGDIYIINLYYFLL
jgi:hypothetical protein